MTKMTFGRTYGLMDKKTRGGAGRGQGRKPVAEGQPTVTVSLRMTVAQRDKLQRLGDLPGKLPDVEAGLIAAWNALRPNG